MRVQGHPRSTVMVPIESPLVVSYLPSIGSNVVSHTIFEIFDAKVLWPRSRTLQGHPRSWCQSKARGRFPIWPPLSPTSYLTVFEIFDAKISWPRSRTVQGIQGQRSWCQSIAHRWFPIRLPLTPSSYLSQFSKYLTFNFNDLELGGVKVIHGQR